MMLVLFWTLLVLVAVIFVGIITTSPSCWHVQKGELNDAGPGLPPLIVSKTLRIYGEKGHLGMIRYHYDATRSSCDTVLLLGVGTFMSVMDYNKLSQKIASDQSIIVIIADHNVDHIIKTSPERYAMLTNGVMSQLHRILPICGHSTYDEGTPQLLFGGHSASGQAAIEAWQQGLLSTAGYKAAFLGLDPYEITNTTIDEHIGLKLPSLSWGFAKTTCLVRTEKSARAAYEISKDSRVMYVVDNEDKGCAVTHCVFTDRGCGFRPLSCGTTAEFEWVYDAVAKSVKLFLQCLRGEFPFDHSHLALSMSLPLDVQVYVNDEHPKTRERFEASSDKEHIFVADESNMY